MSIGFGEILIVLIVALLVLGPERLPEVGRAIGTAVREFRRIVEEVRGEEPPTEGEDSRRAGVAHGRGAATLGPPGPGMDEASGAAIPRVERVEAGPGPTPRAPGGEARTPAGQSPGRHPLEDPGGDQVF